MELGDEGLATIAVESDLAPRIEAALREDGQVLQPAGPVRGVADAAVLISIAVPSIVTLALLVEKLRRMRLPRTYLYPGPHGLDIHIDREVSDGRIVVVGADGSVEELPDKEISAAVLQEALRPPRSAGG